MSKVAEIIVGFKTHSGISFCQSKICDQYN